MSLSISLRSELLKARRTSSIKLCIMGAAILPSLLLVELCNSDEDMSQFKNDPWNLHFFVEAAGVNLAFLPIFVMLVCTMLPQVEYRNQTWKQVLASPQSRAHLILSKFLVVQLHILLFLLLHNLYMTAVAGIAHLVRPSLGFDGHSPDWRALLIFNLNTYLSVFGMSALQFWLGLRFRNFIAPIVIGAVLFFIGSILLFKFEWRHANMYPYFVYTTRSVFPQPALDLTYLQQYGWPSLACGVFFLVLTYADFSRRDFKA